MTRAGRDSRPFPLLEDSMALKRLTSLFLALSITLLCPIADAAVVNGIAAIVNDELITLLDLERETASLAREQAAKSGTISEPAREELKQQALNRIIDRKLIEQKIKELGISVSEEEIRQAVEDVKSQNRLSQEQFVQALASQGISYEQYRLQLKEQLQRLKLMSQEVKSKIQVSDSEIQEYYNANRLKYAGEEKFHARHIFFRLSKEPTEAERAAAKEKAAKALAIARSGKDFVSLAKEFSEDPNAVNDGGDLGIFKRDEMVPEIATVISAMKPGGVSDLVTSSAGIHILKLEEIIPAASKPLEQVRGEIEELLYRKKSEERFNQWSADLKKGASIEILRK